MKVSVRKGLNINLKGAPEKVIADSKNAEIVSPLYLRKGFIPSYIEAPLMFP